MEMHDGTTWKQPRTNPTMFWWQVTWFGVKKQSFQAFISKEGIFVLLLGLATDFNFKVWEKRFSLNVWTVLRMNLFCIRIRKTTDRLKWCAQTETDFFFISILASLQWTACGRVRSPGNPRWFGLVQWCCEPERCSSSVALNQGRQTPQHSPVVFLFRHIY